MFPISLRPDSRVAELQAEEPDRDLVDQTSTIGRISSCSITPATGETVMRLKADPRTADSDPGIGGAVADREDARLDEEGASWWTASFWPSPVDSGPRSAQPGALCVLCRCSRFSRASSQWPAGARQSHAPARHHPHRLVLSWGLDGLALCRRLGDAEVYEGNELPWRENSRPRWRRRERRASVLVKPCSPERLLVEIIRVLSRTQRVGLVGERENHHITVGSSRSLWTALSKTRVDHRECRPCGIGRTLGGLCEAGCRARARAEAS